MGFIRLLVISYYYTRKRKNRPQAFGCLIVQAEDFAAAVSAN